MKEFYQIHEGALTACGPDAATVVVYAQPDAAEKQELLDTLPLDPHDIESALDPDEISRVEIEPGQTYLIWKRPNNAYFEQLLKFEVSSCGLLLRNDRLTVILGDSQVPFSSREFRGLHTANQVVLRFLLHTVHHYLGHLKVIKQITRELESKASASKENRYLLQMFALGESLVYYLSSLEANASALTKLRSYADRLKFSKDDLELIDDIVIEHDQCARQTQIYSTVLSRLMEARGNIINSDINVLLKNLTIINVVFLPLNLLASMGGMSEFSAMTHGVSPYISYALFTLTIILGGWMMWRYLVRKLDSSQAQQRRPPRRKRKE